MKPFALAMAAGLISASAFAVENETPTPAAAPAAAESAPAPAPAVSEPHPAQTSHEIAPAVAASAAEQRKPETTQKARAAGGSEAKTKDKKKVEDARKPALSKQAYARLLAAEIRRRTPRSAADKTGSVHVAFTVGASGRIVSHKVQSSSNPELEPIVGQILASVQTPPPPGGSFSAIQQFNFH